MYGSKAEGLTF